MPDYRSMFGKEYLGHWDLPVNGDVVVTISKVEKKQIENRAKGKVDTRPIIFFEKGSKGMVCNITNGNAIAGMYGPRTEAWIGKPIALFRTTTMVGGETKECIRVRPSIPKDVEND